MKELLLNLKVSQKETEKLDRKCYNFFKKKLQPFIKTKDMVQCQKILDMWTVPSCRKFDLVNDVRNWLK